MNDKCSVIDILMKPKIAGIPLLIIVSLLSIGIYIGGNTYKNSEKYLSHYINYKTFVFLYTLFTFILYALVNYMFGIDTMIGYFLKLNLKPKEKKCNMLY